MQLNPRNCLVCRKLLANFCNRFPAIPLKSWWIYFLFQNRPGLGCLLHSSEGVHQEWGHPPRRTHHVPGNHNHCHTVMIDEQLISIQTQLWPQHQTLRRIGLMNDSEGQRVPVDNYGGCWKLGKPLSKGKRLMETWINYE